MTKKTHLSLFSLFFALFLAFAGTFVLVSCNADGDGGGGGNNGSGPQIPTALRDTQWKHTDGDKVAFSVDSVTTKPASGSEQTFTLKDTSVVEQLSQTTLFFGSAQTSDFIVYRDGSISSVSLGGIQKTYGWSIDDGENNQYAHLRIDSGLVGMWELESETNLSTGDVIRQYPEFLSMGSLLGINHPRRSPYDYYETTRIFYEFTEDDMIEYIYTVSSMPISDYETVNFYPSDTAGMYSYSNNYRYYFSENGSISYYYYRSYTGEYITEPLYEYEISGSTLMLIADRGSYSHQYHYKKVSSVPWTKTMSSGEYRDKYLELYYEYYPLYEQWRDEKDPGWR